MPAPCCCKALVVRLHTMLNLTELSDSCESEGTPYSHIRCKPPTCTDGRTGCRAQGTVGSMQSSMAPAASRAVLGKVSMPAGPHTAGTMLAQRAACMRRRLRAGWAAAASKRAVNAEEEQSAIEAFKAAVSCPLNLREARCSHLSPGCLLHVRTSERTRRRTVQVGGCTLC